LNLFNRQITWIGATGAAICLVLGIFIIPMMIRNMFRRSRLIFGKDCFQCVVGEGMVTHQFPYSNIARIEHVHKPNENFIGIDLREITDPNTLNPRPEATKAFGGWHYRLTSDTWVEPLDKIHDRIRKRIPKDYPEWIEEKK
jgi:hypothetical protein